MLGDAWEDLGLLSPALWGVFCFTFLGQSSVVEEEKGIVLAGTGGPGLAGGHWHKSIDYGITWVDKGKTPGGQAYIYDLVNVGNGIVVLPMGPNDSDVERSPDWGETVVFIKELDVMRRSSQSGTYCGNNIVLVGTDGTLWIGNNAEVHRSIDGGLIWDAGQIISTTPFDSCDALKYLRGKIVVAGTRSGEIARSTDNGATWNLNIFNVGGGNSVRDFAYLGGGVVLLCSQLGDIWRSANSGQNWIRIASLDPQLRALAYAGDNMVFVCGAGGHVWRSLDGGYNWTDLGEILPGNTEVVLSLHYFASRTEQVLVAGFYKPGVAGEARIARTTFPIPFIGVPTDLLCEQKKNPTDVTDPQPEFSAIHHFG